MKFDIKTPNLQEIRGTEICSFKIGLTHDLNIVSKLTVENRRLYILYGRGLWTIVDCIYCIEADCGESSTVYIVSKRTGMHVFFGYSSVIFIEIIK